MKNIHIYQYLDSKSTFKYSKVSWSYWKESVPGVGVCCLFAADFRGAANKSLRGLWVDFAGTLRGLCGDFPRRIRLPAWLTGWPLPRRCPAALLACSLISTPDNGKGETKKEGQEWNRLITEELNWIGNQESIFSREKRWFKKMFNLPISDTN